jgi:hypothetical protein
VLFSEFGATKALFRRNDNCRPCVKRAIHVTVFCNDSNIAWLPTVLSQPVNYSQSSFAFVCPGIQPVVQLLSPIECLKTARHCNTWSCMDGSIASVKPWRNIMKMYQPTKHSRDGRLPSQQDCSGSNAVAYLLRCDEAEHSPCSVCHPSRPTTNNTTH